MSTIPQIYDQSELALAAYANLTPGVTNDLVRREALVAAGFSAKQAEEFAKKYPVVVAQFNDTEAEGGLGTSFSATVFKDAAGNLTLAIRGTLEAGDFVPTDATIATSGVGYDQVVAMWNWWQRVSNPSGTAVTQYRLVATPADLSHATWIAHAGAGNTGLWLEWYTGTANGSLRDVLAADADQKLDLTGHSLGGHLAMAFGSIFPSASNQITVFNAPGFLDDADNRTFFALLGGAIPIGANTTNVIADEANVGLVPWSGIAGLHSRPGSAIGISIENQWQGDEPLLDRPGALNHSQQILTDALAVYATLAKLDAALSPATFKAILNAAAVGTSASLERIVDVIEKFFGINSTPLPAGNANRDALYQALYGLQGNALYQATQGRAILENLTNKSADGLVGLAKHGDIDALAYRYALKELNPFAILGLDYSRFNANGELDRLNPLTGQGGLTDEYLTDRAAMLYWALKYNVKDGLLTENIAGDTQWVFDDKTSATRIILSPKGYIAGPESNLIFGRDDAGETLRGGVWTDRLYGGGGDDILKGDKGNDYLEGGAGIDELDGGANNDTLYGGRGDDILRGGAGEDTYVINSGDGHDRIVGEDGGRNYIRYNGRLIAGSFVQSTPGGAYRFVGEGGFTLQFNSPGVLTLDENTSITFDNYSSADAFEEAEFGIELIDAASALTPTRTILGDLEPIDNDPVEPGVQTVSDDLGNPVTSGEAPGRSDTLHDSAGSDLIQAGGGNDTVHASRGGADRIEAGAGRDTVDAGEGDDLVLGGAGADILEGQAGADRLYADGEIDIAQAVALGNSQSGSGSQGDWLNGGTGDDLLVAGADNDALFGGAGEDLLIGGAGDDVLDGDDDYTAAEFDWRIEAGASPFDPVFTLARSNNPSPLAGAADVLYGGAGNDILLGLLGNDILYGEAGNDALAGDDHDDILLGGEGDDWMTGDGNGRLEYPTGGLVVQGNDWLDGGAGADWLQGEGGDDDLYGGAGDDTLIGDAGYLEGARHGEDWLDGEDGADTLVGGGQADVLTGGAGNDTLIGDGTDVAAAYHGADILDGGEGDDLLKGDGGNDILIGGEGNDELQGDEGADRLDGGAGDDRLFGGEGNDTLIGGAGADALSGGAGTDTFIADGRDSIHDEDGGGSVRFEAVWRAEDLTVSLEGGALVLSDAASGTEVSIVDGDLGGMSRYEFADGSALDHAQLMAAAQSAGLGLAGTGAADRLIGSRAADTLAGDAGNDVLLGQAGDDTYVLNLGDGQDRIEDNAGRNVLRFGAGIAPASLSLVNYPEGWSLLAYGDQGDVLRIEAGVLGAVARLEFDDGTTLTWAELMRTAAPLATGGSGREDTIFGSNHADTLGGGAGDDALDGQGGDDVLDGGEGDDALAGGAGADLLAGGAGDDRYAFAAGSGIDLVVDGEGANEVVFGAGIEAAGLAVAQIVTSDGRNCLALGAGADRLLIEGGELGAVRSFRFADGTVLGLEDILARLPRVVGTGTAAADTIAGAGGDDVLNGNDGNDTLEGRGGGDALDGGEGDDVLRGGDGDDVLRGAGGDDRLEGGAGADVYRFGYGAGSDLVIEAGGEYSVLALEPGLTAAALDARREGDDLILAIRGTGDSVRLAGYALQAVDWRIRLYGGSESAMEAFLAGMGGGQDLVAREREAYRQALTGAQLSDLVRRGYVLEADGQFHLRSTTAFATSSMTYEYQHSGLMFASLSGDEAETSIDGAAGSQVNLGMSTSEVPIFRRRAFLGEEQAGAGNSPDQPFFVPAGTASRYQVPMGSTRVAMSSASGAFLGLWIYPPAFFENGGTLDVSGSTSGQMTRTVYRYAEGMTVTEFTGGAGDNTIWAGSPALVNAGDGDDAIHAGEGGAFVFEGFGAFLEGGAGNDRIAGSRRADVLVGGEGADLLDGANGADRYVLINEIDADLIVDSGEIGIENQWFSGAPVAFANTATENDVLLFPDGVAVADLRFSWRDELVELPSRHYFALGSIGPLGSDRTQSVTKVLVIEWSGGGVRVMMPHDDTRPAGIEAFRFGDGSSLTRAQLLALAPPADLDPHLGDNDISGSGSLSGFAGNDVIAGSGGGDYLDGGDGADRLSGGAGNDVLAGGAGADLLLGGEGNDTLGVGAHEFFGAGNVYRGGAGDDRLLGSADADTYYFELGDGHDTITDFQHEEWYEWAFGDYTDIYYGGPVYFDQAGAPAGFDMDAPPQAYPGRDVLRFGAGIQPGEISLEQEGYDLVLRHANGTDSVRFQNWYNGAERPLRRIEFADGTAWTGTMIASPGEYENLAPQRLAPIGGVSARRDQAFAFAVPAGTFADADSAEALAFAATLEDGSALPDWLSFDAASGVFSGTPGSGDVGLLRIRLEAYDALGASAHDVFSLDVSEANRVVGTAGDDRLIGTAAPDILEGYAGNDVLNGGAGADTLIGGAGDDIYRVDDAGDVVTELAGEGVDRVIATVSYALGENLENLTLSGTAAIAGSGNALDNVLVGNAASNTLDGRAGDDRLTGGDADDVLLGGEGNDVLNGAAGADAMLGGAGDDIYRVDNTGDAVTELAGEGVDRVVATVHYLLTDNIENLTLSGSDDLAGSGNVLDNRLTGNAGINLLSGGAGDDRLNGAGGLDFLEGGEGADVLADTSGVGYFNGGAGDDVLRGDGAADFHLGGAGNDNLNSGTGADVIAFNLGDGQDTLAASAGADNTLSLGGGIAYADLGLRKSGNHLVIEIGASDRITLSNWYAAPDNRSVLRLQVIAEAMADFDAGGADPLRDNRVETFDFAGLAGAFDAARAANPGLTRWAIAEALTAFHLAGSDSEALGGDLAYQYGRNGTLAGIGLGAAQEVLGDAQFGVQAQALRPLAGLQDGPLRLG